MTQEEAIKIIRDTYHTDEEMNALEVLIPQLRESEDERIRKHLIKHFSNKSKEEWNGMPIKDILAWLEKQKEPKKTDLPAGFYFIDLDGNKYYSKEFRYGDMKLKVREQKPAEWSEDDEKAINDACCFIEEYAGYIKGIDRERSSMLFRIANKLKSLRPCPSWKPSEEQMEALAYAIQVLGSDLSPKAAKAGEELEHLREQLKKL